MIASSGSSSGSERQPGAADVVLDGRCGGDAHLVPGGDAGVGEGNERPEVPGAAGRGEEDAHTSPGRRPRAAAIPPSVPNSMYRKPMIEPLKSTSMITISGVMPPFVGPEPSAENHEPIRLLSVGTAVPALRVEVGAADARSPRRTG